MILLRWSLDELHEYLIDQSGKDWSASLKGWGSVLPASCTLWLVNRFGDLSGFGRFRFVWQVRRVYVCSFWRFSRSLPHSVYWLFLTVINRPAGCRGSPAAILVCLCIRGSLRIDA
jgi:hypothetical protein